jgi:hypothetical protein
MLEIFWVLILYIMLEIFWVLILNYYPPNGVQQDKYKWRRFQLLALCHASLVEALQAPQ